MRFDRFKTQFYRHKVFILAVTWFVFIFSAHIFVNGEHYQQKVVKMGYMPVITNLAAPLLDKASRDKGDVFFQAVKFSSFSEMGEALRNDTIDVAFMIAPLSIVLRQQGEDVKVVYIGNRNESTLVVRTGQNIKTIAQLAGKTIAVPLRFSGHNIILMNLREKYGLNKSMKIVEMNPTDMPAALLSGALDAYFVGEPFASGTLVKKKSEVLFLAEEIDENFICNLMLVKNDFIKKDSKTVKSLVESAARSGVWAQNNIEEAAVIASEYWNQPIEIILHALTNKKGRIVFNRFKPKEDEIQKMAQAMLKLKMIKNDNIKDLVDDHFADRADLENINDFSSILR